MDASACQSTRTTNESDMTQAERNEIARKRMLDLTQVRLGKVPQDSPWVRPARVFYTQDGREKVWDVIRQHDSVCVIVLNVSRGKLVLVKQFRPGTYHSWLPEGTERVDVERYPATLGVTLELCAGIVDKDKPLVEIARDELREECGYEAPVEAFNKIITYRFADSTSKQTIFYVEVTDDMHIHPGGGSESEGELIEVVEMSVEEAKEYMKSDDVQSPPSFLYGISWFLANKCQ